MNLTPSLSSSPSSSTSTSPVSFSFDSKGCIAGILNRILPFRIRNNLPTYPIIEPNSIFEELEEAKQTQSSDEIVTPSVVARLMGLDSMPRETAIQKSNPIRRSVSANSLERNEVKIGHRRVNKSGTISVFEMKGYFELENEEFLVLSFENGSEETKKKIKRRKKKKKKRVENECSSEESSPVSVLDFDQFLTDHQLPRSELETNLAEPFSRRKLSSELENSGFPFAPTDRNDTNLMICENKRGSEGKCVKNCFGDMEIWDQICKMVGDEIAVSSTWLYRESKSKSKNILKRHEDFEEICADFELQILDELVQEFVQLHINHVTSPKPL